MKAKTKNIVGIVISALVLPVSGYGAFLLSVAMALVVGFDQDGFGADDTKVLLLLLAAVIVSVVALTFLVLCSVKLAKINKQEKELKVSGNVASEQDQIVEKEEIAQSTTTEE